MTKPGNTTARGLGHAHRTASATVMATAKVCATCGGQPAPTNPLERGHIISRALGGRPGRSNYTVAGAEVQAS